MFPNEQKGCRKGSWGTVELLYIDKHILNESKNKRKNLAMALINYKKAYNMVSQSWIINCLKMYKISHETINFIEKNMKNWRVELTAGGKSLAETKIQRGIFQGDALSPLLFIIAMMPLNHILRKCSWSQEKVNHLMYMDDIKLFAKNEKELETLIHTIRIYSQDIRMEFGIEKCALLVMKSVKLPKSRQDQNACRKRDLQILRNLGGWHHQTSRNENKIQKDISGELENYSRQNSIAETLSKE